MRCQRQQLATSQSLIDLAVPDRTWHDLRGLLGTRFGVDEEEVGAYWDGGLASNIFRGFEYHVYISWH